jgi:Ca-activated chloride channel family protein
MRKLASAGGGDYVSLTASDEDISQLMAERVQATRHRTDDRFNQTSRWKENGPWLVILLLPLAALAFRRGWLLSIAVLIVTGTPTEPAMAFTMNDLWQRQDQQAHQALIEGDIENAAKLAQDPLRKGVAEYKQGNYQAALKDFAAASGAEAAYNKGNALAKLGKYKEAIDAYEQALEERQDMEDARYNKGIIEKLLQQQQQSQNNDNGENQDQDNQQGQQGKQDKQSGDSNGQQSESNENRGESQQGESGQQQTEQGESGKGTSEQDQDQDSTSASSQAEQKQTDEQNAFSDAAQQAAAQVEEDASKSKQGMSGNESSQQEDTTAVQEQHSGQEKEGEGDVKLMTEAEQQERQADDKSISAKPTTAESLNSEEQIAAEQWLRRIPDDPAGLLRRKLRYQYIQRGGQAGNGGEAQAW